MPQLSTDPPIDDLAGLALFNQVSQILGSSLDLTQVLNQVMDAIIQLTGAERGFLMLVGRDTPELDLRAGRNVDRVTIDGDEMEVSRTVISRVVEKGQPVLTYNAQEDPRFSQQMSVVGYALRSVMCAPLWARGKILGAVYVDNRVRSGVFSESQLSTLATFANQAAMAIENARLFTMTDQALAARVEELSILQRIDRELNTSLDFDRVMDLALEWAVKLADADGGMLLLLEEGAETARVVASRGRDAAPDRVPLAHPAISHVLANGESVVMHGPVSAQSVDGTPAIAQVAVPIKREGRVTALLALESSRENIFDEDKVAFLERLADHAAIAIENVRLYDAVVAATDAKSTLISLVSHELRVPMTSIKGYTEMLEAGAAGPVTEMQLEFLDTIQRSVDRMSVLVSDLSDINRMESGRLRLDSGPVDLADVIDEAVAGLQTQFVAKGQTVSVDIPDDLPSVLADRSRTVQILTNLLSNANKYSPKGRPVTVTAENVDREGRRFLRVAVTDQGIGITPEDQAQLFTQFFRSLDPAVRDETGWGLGLSIVKMMVEAQGGAITVESTPGVGSCFAFTLAVADDS
ncbi:MAG: GAF domain-containing protein [Ardenticatenales bacterium]|nr:GAF domain-containing protein [Ardenticatenales bacterium]